MFLIEDDPRLIDFDRYYYYYVLLCIIIQKRALLKSFRVVWAKELMLLY